MNDDKKEPTSPPEIGPYVFPVILVIFGLWCLYDGWLTSNPEMKGYQLMNRLGSLIILPWSIIDFIRTWKIENACKSARYDQSENNDTQS